MATTEARWRSRRLELRTVAAAWLCTPDTAALDEFDMQMP